MVLAVLFVPVLFIVPFSALMAPCSYLLFEFVTRFNPRKLGAGEIVMIFYLGYYFMAFFVIAWCAFQASTLAKRKHLKLMIQCLLLLGLFSCSFLTVIRSQGAGGNSGIYNFWTACARYWKTHDHS